MPKSGCMPLNTTSRAFPSSKDTKYSGSIDPSLSSQDFLAKKAGLQP